MNILIDTISTKGKLIAYEGTQILKEKDIHVLGSEYNDFLDLFLGFLNEMGKDFKDIGGITAVNGPGGFTGTRIISLILNTIQFVNQIKLEPIDYFTFLEKSGASYPMIIRANRTEYLYKENQSAKPVIMPKTDIIPGAYSGIGDIMDFENGDISISSDIDYASFIRNNKFAGTNSRIEPYYIKKPNIT